MLKINVTKFVKSRIKGADTLLESKHQLYAIASAAQILSKADPSSQYYVEPYKAEHIARLVNRYGQFVNIVTKPTIYLFDIFRIIALVVDELTDEITHPYFITEEMDKIKSFMSSTSQGRLIFSSEDILA